MSLQEQVDEILKNSITECADQYPEQCNKCLKNVGDFCIKYGVKTNIHIELDK